MKLVIAVVNEEIEGNIIDRLSKNSFRAIKICSSGNFLGNKNTTLLIGVRDKNINTVIDIIKSNAAAADEFGYNPLSPCPVEEFNKDYTNMDVPGDVGFIRNTAVDYRLKAQGWATIFVVNIKRYEKLINIADYMIQGR